MSIHGVALVPIVQTLRRQGEGSLDQLLANSEEMGRLWEGDGG